MAQKTKKKKKFVINHNHELCKGCGLCYEYCPKNVIEPDILGRAQFIRPEDCIGCQKCVWICPDFAIWIEEDTSNNGQKKDDTADEKDKNIV